MAEAKNKPPPELHRSIAPPRGSMIALMLAEILAVLKVGHTNSTRNWAMILLAYRHGLRASEIWNLKLGDLDMKAGCLSIRRLKGSLHTTQPIYRHKGQPLLDEQAALRAWLRDRDPDGSDYLFTSQKGGWVHRSQFFPIFRDCAFAAGLPPEKHHPHALKH
jgi:integrase